LPAIQRCPKCAARFAPARPEVSECPHCGIWFHKWDAFAARGDSGHADEAPADEEMPALDPLRFYGRVALLLLVAVWGWRLAAMDYRDAEINGSFMHNIVLPIHEAGHVFFMPFGEFLGVLGGSLFQVALPLGIAAAFLLRQRDPFAASICLWWAGASLVDIAPYIWDSLEPRMLLLGGHTGADGPHDWIYLLERFGALGRAHAWGVAVHHLSVLIMVGGLAAGALCLWRQQPAGRRGGESAS